LGRLFFALPLPEEQRQAIHAVVSPYLDQCRENLTIVDPSLYHATFHFIGIIPQDLRDKLLQDCASLQLPTPFSCTLKSTGVFPHYFGPRVLWVSLEAQQALYDTFSELERCITSSGIMLKPDNGFKPHITVARVKKTCTQEEKIVLKEFLAQEFSTISPWTVTHIDLLESTVHQEEPTYKMVKRFPLDNTIDTNKGL